MNHTFKVIFSKVLGCFVVVSEHVKGHGKSSKNAIATAALLAIIGGNAYAGPTNGVVIQGAVDIHQAGNLTTITQATKRAIVNWNTFNIAHGETVEFKQPDVSSAILNRVMSTSPSLIDGVLKSNGNVFLINAGGVVIGKNANVNVGGIVASTLDIKDSDFMAGAYRLSSTTSGNVSNEGNITVSNGGIAALFGSKVSNQGYINAYEGSAFIAAAEQVTLTLGDGATAHSLVIDKAVLDALVDVGGAIRVGGGQVILAAHTANTLVHKAINQTGIIEAVSMAQQGGKIVLDGGAMGRVDISGTMAVDGSSGGTVHATGRDVMLTGDITATGTTKGGSVLIGGGIRGQDPSIENAKNVAMTRNASIDVSATELGTGGTAVLFSTGSTVVTGNFKATGGDQGGDGGFVETSGKVVQFDGKVDASAAKGKGGGYLLDPDIIVITSNPVEVGDAQLPMIDNLDVGDSGTNGYGSTTTISKSALEAVSSGYIQLEADGYIKIGDLTAAGGDGVLSLQPDTDLYLVTRNQGSAGINFSTIPGQGPVGGIFFDNPNNTIKTSGFGSIALQAGVYASGAHVQSVLYNIGNVETDAGDIELQGSQSADIKGNIRTNSGSIWLNGDYDASGAGRLMLHGDVATISGYIELKSGNTSGSGVDINGSINVGSGELTMTNTYSGIDDYQEDYQVRGSIEAINDLVFDKYLTLSGGASLKTQGSLILDVGMAIAPNSSVELIASKFATGDITTAYANTTVTIKAPSPTTNLNLAGDAVPGYSFPINSSMTPTNLIIGSSDYQGKITVGGVSDSSTNVSILAGGVGGSIDLNDFSSVAASHLNIEAAGDITFNGASSTYVGAAAGLSIIAGGNLNINDPGATIGSGPQAILSIGNNFNNSTGASLLEHVDRWIIFANNADTLTGTGFTLGDGFRRYGCTYASGCAPGTQIPGSGNGFFFKDAPVLNISALNNSITYGNSFTPGNAVSYSGFINGDTEAMLGLTGNATTQFVTAPTLSSGGYIAAGNHALSSSVGTLANQMGYTFIANTNPNGLQVNKADITVGPYASNKVYDGNTAAYTEGTLQGVLTNDLVGNTSIGTFSDKNVGTAKTVSVTYTLDGLDANNYNLTNAVTATTANITPKLLTNSISASSKVYDGTTNATATISASGRVTGDDLVWSIVSANFSDKNVGTGKTVNITAGLSGADAGNYEISGGNTRTRTADITHKILPVPAITVFNKTYDGTDYASAYIDTLSGVVAGEGPAIDVIYDGYFSDKNAGNGKNVRIDLTLIGMNSGNYLLSANSVNLTANISKAYLDIGNIVTANKIYDGTTAASTAADLLHAVAGDAVVLNTDSSTFDSKNVGSGKTVNTSFSLSGADANNYTIWQPNKTSTADITPKQVNAINIATANKIYDGTTQATTTAGLSGVVTGDTASTIVTSSTFADKNAGVNKSVSSTLGLTGVDAGNYILASGTALTNASITQKLVTPVMMGTFNKTYDGDTGAFAFVNQSGILNSDDAGIIYDSNFSDKNVGTNKTVTTTVGLLGLDAGNYVLSTDTLSSSANINARTVYLTNVLTNNKVYDGTVSATTVAGLDDTIAGDNISAVVTGSSFSDKNAGTNKDVVTTFALSGADSSNYVLDESSANSTATIAKKVVTPVMMGTFDKTYDGDTDAFSFVNQSGILNNDAAGIIYDSQFSDKNVGTGKAVTTTVGLLGIDSANYELSTSTLTSTADIGVRTVYLTNVNTLNKVYDGTINATTTAQLDDFITGDDVAASSASSSFADKNAGSAKSVTSSFVLTGSDASNYVLDNSAAASSADIAKKQLNAINVTTANKVYDGTTAATTTAALDAVVTNDTVTLSSITSAFQDKNAGINKTVSTTFTLSGIDASNYDLANNVIAGSADVEKKQLQVALGSIQNKVYDSTTVAAITGSGATGAIAGDDINVTASGAFSDKHAATNKNVAVTYQLIGADATNYSLDSTTSQGTADITKRPVSFNVSASDPVVIEANGSAIPNSLFSVTLDGPLPGDAVQVGGIGFALGGSMTDGSQPGEYQAVVSGLTGADANNYVVNYGAGSQSVTVKVTAPVVVVPPVEEPEPQPPVVVPEPPVVVPEPQPPVVVPEPPVVVPEPQPPVVVPEPPVVVPEPQPPVVVPEPPVVLPEPLPVPSAPGPIQPPVVPPIAVVLQTDSYNPVYASGRVIDTRGVVSGSAGEVVDVTDTQKGQQVTAVGTRRYSILDDMKIGSVTTETINLPANSVTVTSAASADKPGGVGTSVLSIETTAKTESTPIVSDVEDEGSATSEIKKNKR